MQIHPSGLICRSQIVLKLIRIKPKKEANSQASRRTGRIKEERKEGRGEGSREVGGEAKDEGNELTSSLRRRY